MDWLAREPNFITPTTETGPTADATNFNHHFHQDHRWYWWERHLWPRPERGWLASYRIKAKDIAMKDLRMPQAIPCVHRGHGKSIVTDSEPISGAQEEARGWFSVGLLCSWKNREWGTDTENCIYLKNKLLREKTCLSGRDVVTESLDPLAYSRVKMWGETGSSQANRVCVGETEVKIVAQAIFIAVNVDSGVCVCYPSIILTTIRYPFETVTFGVRSWNEKRCFPKRSRTCCLIGEPSLGQEPAQVNVDTSNWNCVLFINLSICAFGKVPPLLHDKLWILAYSYYIMNIISSCHHLLS